MALTFKSCEKLVALAHDPLSSSMLCKLTYLEDGHDRSPFHPWRWLIDLEGLRDVDICNAYADAQGTSYPGDSGCFPCRNVNLKGRFDGRRCS